MCYISMPVYANQTVNPVPPPLITTAKCRPSSVRHTPPGRYLLQNLRARATQGLLERRVRFRCFQVPHKEHSSGPSVTHVVEQERRFLAFSTPYWTCRITCITCDLLRAWTPAGIPILWKPSEPPTLHIARTGAK